jgi:hypothetical protein
MLVVKILVFKSSKSGITFWKGESTEFGATWYYMQETLGYPRG